MDTVTTEVVNSSYTASYATEPKWSPVILLIGLGIVLAVFMIFLCWRAAKGKSVGLLVIVTVAVALLLFAGFLSVAIGMKIEILVLAGMVIGSILVLAARFFAWLGAADPAGAAVNPEERKRILGMVEQGKMTGTEGAELLDALGKSSALRGQQTFGRLDVAILVGTAMVVLGFFLRWAIVKNAWQLNLMKKAFGTDTLTMTFAGYDMTFAGYDMGAVGWAVLICAILAALLVFITPKDYLYKLVLLQVLSVCVGLALVVSVWWRAGRYVGAGTVICCMGFVFALIASGMKLRALGR